MDIGARYEWRIASDVAEIDAGDNFTCARRTNGTVACWGDGDNRQLGLPATTDSPPPLDIAGITDAVELFCPPTESVPIV